MPIGLPPLLRPPTAIADVTKLANSANLLVADAAIVVHLLAGAQKWGIFLGGKLQLNPDSMKSFDYRQATKISDYPQEAGAFQSYNKVATPFDARVELTKGGSESDRATFLAAIEKAAASLELYDVVTPEKTYLSCNIERFDLRRTADSGAGLLTVDIWLVQVRISAAAAFANSKQPSGMAVQNVGTVQPQKPTDAVTNFVGRVPPPLKPITNFVGVIR